MKNLLVRASASVVGAICRRSPSRRLRAFLVQHLFEPYFGWRQLALTASTSFGARMALDLPDSIQSKIFLTGQWEPDITRWIKRSLRPGDIFVDVGANIGYYTLLAAHCVGATGRVYAIEASPNIYKKLRQNLSLNPSLQATVLNMAVSNRLGTVSIWHAPPGNLGHSTIIESVAATDGHYQEAIVECDALGNMIPIEDLLNARLVKIDIEGAERMAIEGLLPLLDQVRPDCDWLIELSPAFAPRGLEDTRWIFETFIAMGYSAYLVGSADGSTSRNFSQSADLRPLESTPTARLCDVLFTRRTSPLPAGVGA